MNRESIYKGYVIPTEIYNELIQLSEENKRLKDEFESLRQKYEQIPEVQVRNLIESLGQMLDMELVGV